MNIKKKCNRCFYDSETKIDNDRLLNFFQAWLDKCLLGKILLVKQIKLTAILILMGFFWRYI